MKKAAFIIAYMALSLPAFAGEIPSALIDSTSTPSQWPTIDLTWIAGLLYALYEISVRFIPTVKDFSVLSYIMKVIQLLLPNLKKGGGRHNVG